MQSDSSSRHLATTMTTISISYQIKNAIQIFCCKAVIPNVEKAPFRRRLQDLIASVWIYPGHIDNGKLIHGTSDRLHFLSSSQDDLFQKTVKLVDLNQAEFNEIPMLDLITKNPDFPNIWAPLYWIILINSEVGEDLGF